MLLVLNHNSEFKLIKSTNHATANNIFLFMLSGILAWILERVKLVRIFVRYKTPTIFLIVITRERNESCYLQTITKESFDHSLFCYKTL